MNIRASYLDADGRVIAQTTVNDIDKITDTLERMSDDVEFSLDDVAEIDSLERIDDTENISLDNGGILRLQPTRS